MFTNKATNQGLALNVALEGFPIAQSVAMRFSKAPEGWLEENQELVYKAILMIRQRESKEAAGVIQGAFLY